MSDDQDALRKKVLATCEKLPDTELTHPFGEQTAVYKVAGKMFAAVRLDEPPVHVTVKCEPDYAASLVAKYDKVEPGYHMDKKHWITVTLSAGLPKNLVDELIVDSYHLVVEGLPAKDQPTEQ